MGNTVMDIDRRYFSICSQFKVQSKSNYSSWATTQDSWEGRLQCWPSSRICTESFMPCQFIVFHKRTIIRWDVLDRATFFQISKSEHIIFVFNDKGDKDENNNIMVPHLKNIHYLLDAGNINMFSKWYRYIRTSLACHFCG